MSKTVDAAALDREQPTYMEQLLHGQVLMDSIDDFIDAWHDAPAGSRVASQSLHEFLGMSWDEYRLWVERPEALRFITAARRQGKPVEEVLATRDRYGLAARSGTQGEPHELLQWLIERGRVQEPPV